MTLGIRPHNIAIRPPEEAAFGATVALIERTGAETMLTCVLPSGRKVCVVGPAHIAARNGDRIGLAVDAAHLRCFDTATGKALAA